MADDTPPVSERALAETYDGGYYRDAWEVVQQYRRVTAYASVNPDRGSAAIASRFEDVPRGRIRPWIDGDAAPDPVRCIETARDNGWLEARYGDEVFAGLNGLVANVFSGGSIAASTYTPSFSLDDTRNASVFDAFEKANVEYRIVTDRDDRADEVWPTENASVLGRVLAALGAPVGPKANRRLSLPAYLEDAPPVTRRRFVEHYLENRATEGAGTVRFREERNDAYLGELAELLEDVTGESVTVSGKNVVLSKSVEREIDALG